jgi:hypothetical protein
MKITTELNNTYNIRNIHDLITFCYDHNLIIANGTIEILNKVCQSGNKDEINDFLE